MTPEAENELVARWMGWECLEGYLKDWHRCGVYLRFCPDYRTDPALLWGLMERLMKCGGWLFHPGPYGGFIGERDAMQTSICATLAEAVFAAAVMQAQEGK